MSNVPFTVSKLVHNNLTHLMSANDDKFDFVDANRIPYAVKFNPVIENFFSVADENGFIKFFSSHPNLKPIKEISAQKSCIYDLQWLNSHEIACGGGDQHVSIFDVNTCVRLAILKGHTESVKSITQLASNPFVIASGSRDGSVLIFDVRFNRTSDASDPNVSYIRAINSIQKAHFVEDPSSTYGTKSNLSTLNNRFLNVLKSKSSNASPSKTAALQLATRRPSPVASVLFQSEHLLISAGATDGLIKVWDTRKIYTCSNSKKYIDQSPLYIFDNQTKTGMNHVSGGGKSSKGYSNIIMNNAGTRLYANCMNSLIYEYNYQTYNQSHTRILNSTNIQKYNSSQASKPAPVLATTEAPGEDKPKSRYHTNQSNFIKAKISQCDNYILTGSSDFNAYIYPTSTNNDCDSFRKHLPVITLKGHTNEVTAVDWNPINSNQLVTCSDDNTIRLWNVRREVDMLRANECNFCLAETINEFEDELSKQDEGAFNPVNDRSAFMPMIRNRKFAPFHTGVFDDLMFTNFEYRNFIKRTSPEKVKQNDLEAELCKKWNNISIGTSENELRQPKSSRNNEFHSSASNSNESSFLENDALETKISEFVILQLDTLTSNMPINIISEEEKNIIQSNSQPKVETTKPDRSNFFKRQSSKSMLLSSTSAIATTQAKSSTVRNKPLRQQKLESSPESKMKLKEHTTPRQGLKKIALSTAKKRNALQSGLLQCDITDGIGNDEPRTPVSKRRLIMCDSVSNSPSTPKNGGIGPTAAVNSPIRSILHYFSPKPAQK